jgi:exodeoxyribonuclease V beta subunit
VNDHFNQRVLDRSFDLREQALIEASAGTGKTYCIQTLFLRLVVEYGFRVDEILTVTFTELATKELRDRLRKILHRCARRMEGALAEDDPDLGRVDAILALPLRNPPAEAPPREDLQRQRIRQALLDFDQAAIFTLHGFCHRTLDRFAFECGHDFDAQLVASGDDLLEEVCRDWWRTNIYPASELDLRAARAAHLSLATLRDGTRRRIAKPYAQFDRTGLADCDDACGKLQQLIAFWDGHAEALGETLTFAGEVGRLPSGLEATLPAQACDRTEEGARMALRFFDDWAAALSDAAKAPPALVIPSGMDELAQCCEDLHRHIDEKQVRIRSGAWSIAGGGLTREAWEQKLHALTHTYLTHQNRVDRFLALAPGFFKKAGAWSDEFSAEARSVFADPSADPKAAKKVFRSFCRSRLEANARTRFSWDPFAPVATFLGLYGEFADVLRNYGRRRLLEGIDVCGRTCAERRRRRNQLTYDDLLTRVQSALEEPSAGARLAASLREQYRAALVDEFQDTDPIQYSIFRRLFETAEGDPPLFYVGDPKQSIYSFRSGDIFTFYSAVDALPPERHHSLSKNWRSESALVEAFKLLFADKTDEDGGVFPAFGDARIRHPVSLEAAGKPPEGSLLFDGRPDPAPLRLWFYSGEDGGTMPGDSGRRRARIAGAVADEVVGLLNDPAATLGERRLRPSDIAVLVHSHDRAREIHRHLRTRCVPAVLQNTGSVFDTEEARDLRYLVRAIVCPGDLTAIRTALTTPLLPCTEPELAAMQDGESPPPRPRSDQEAGPVRRLEDWLELFHTANAIWRRGTFLHAFRFLGDRTGLQAHLVASALGERRLTNLLQLAHLLHRAELEEHLNPETLLSWLDARLLEPAEGTDAEEYQLRLESDDDALKIMTVHSSKGLQFPVVFVPTLCEMDDQLHANVGSFIEYHGEEEAGAPLMIGQKGMDPDGEAAAAKERNQEQIRLLYVAVTRAVNRCYLVGGNFNKKHGSPVARLLGSEPETSLGLHTMGEPPICVERRTDAEPEPAGQVWKSSRPRHDPADLQSAHERLGKGKPFAHRGGDHTSFSALSPRTSAPQLAEAPAEDYDAEDASTPAQAPVGPTAGIFAVPGGERTGRCWHAIFEHIDFAADADARRAVVTEQMHRYGLLAGQDRPDALVEAVDRMVAATLQAQMPLAPPAPLHEISGTDRRAEMAFHFPLRHSTARHTESLRRTLEDHWRDDPRQRIFLDRLGDWSRPIPRGFLTGVIDLVYRHEGRYYVLDWKSNRLEGTPASFNEERIRAEVTHHAYFLQYLIYTVAVHNYLDGALQDYDYERDFGGVLYVFLRGMPSVPQQSVYTDRPSLALVEAIGRKLGVGR